MREREHSQESVLSLSRTHWTDFEMQISKKSVPFSSLLHTHNSKLSANIEIFVSQNLSSVCVRETDFEMQISEGQGPFSLTHTHTPQKLSARPKRKEFSPKNKGFFGK